MEFSERNRADGFFRRGTTAGRPEVLVPAELSEPAVTPAQARGCALGKGCEHMCFAILGEGANLVKDERPSGFLSFKDQTGQHK